MYKQVIIARKDLGMSAGKLAAQVSHASMAFLTNLLRNQAYITVKTKNDTYFYGFEYTFDKDLYEQWIMGSFTKVVCEAKNKDQLLKVVQIANDLGLKENVDFFLIKDNCLTELEPEEIDNDGNGRTLTCIGFKPMEKSLAEKISKKYHLWT